MGAVTATLPPQQECFGGRMASVCGKWRNGRSSQLKHGISLTTPLSAWQVAEQERQKQYELLGLNPLGPAFRLRSSPHPSPHFVPLHFLFLYFLSLFVSFYTQFLHDNTALHLILLLMLRHRVCQHYVQGKAEGTWSHVIFV